MGYYRIYNGPMPTTAAQAKVATLTYMSLEQGLLTGKIGLDRVFAKGEFRSNEY